MLIGSIQGVDISNKIIEYLLVIVDWRPLEAITPVSSPPSTVLVVEDSDGQTLIRTCLECRRRHL